MAEIASAFVTLAPSARGFGSKLTSQVGGEVRSAGSRIGGVLGGALKVGLLAGVAGVGAAFVSGFKDAIEYQKLQAQTAAVLKSTGGAAHVTAKKITNLAGKIASYSDGNDDAVQEGANLLLTFTNIRNEAGKGNKIFDQTTKIMYDMSTALGQDTKSSALQLGKALNDPIKGVTALQRVGVSFTDDQKEQIKTLVESGKTMKAQKLILGELSKEFGGSAKAVGDTFAGAWGRLKDKMGDLLRSVVEKLLPKLTRFVDWLDKKAIPKLSEWWDKLAPARKAISKFAHGVEQIIKLIRDGKWDEAWQKVKDAMGRALTATLDAAKNFLTKKLLPAIVNALASIRDAWRKKWTNFWKDPDGAYNKTERRTDTFGVRMSDKMSRIGISVIGSLMKGLSKLPAIAYRNGVSIVSGLGLGMQGMPRLMIAIGTNSITGLMKGLAAAPGLARTMGVRIVGALKDGVGNLSHLLYGAGAELIQGLIDGIESKLGALASTMGGVASKIKGFLPGSPVKEGPLTSWNRGGAGKRLIDQGLIAGIEARRRSVGASMDRLASGISLPSADLAVAGVGQVGGSAAHSGGGRRAIHIHLGDREFVRYIDERIDTHFDLTREHARASR